MTGCTRSSTTAIAWAASSTPDGAADQPSRADYTAALPEIVAEAKALPVTSALLDGEMVVLLDDGRASFQALQSAMGKAGLKDPQPRTPGAGLLVFDLLEIDGEALLAGRWTSARRACRRSFARGGGQRIRFADHVVGHGPAFFEQATRSGVEGIVSKRRDGAY